MIGIWINRFRVFVNRANLTPNKTSVVVIPLLAFHILLRLKIRDNYTPEGSVDEIQSNGS